MSTLETLKKILKHALHLGARADALTADSHLIGAIPELDSMGVVHLMAAIEDEFGVSFPDDEIHVGIFATLGSLAQYIDYRQTA